MHTGMSATSPLMEDGMIDSDTLIEALREIANGRVWDGLEIIRREMTDAADAQTVAELQQKVEKPW